MFFFSATKRNNVAIARLQLQMEDAMSQISDLQAQVAQQDSVIGSAVTLINGFADRLKAAGTDADALASLSAEIGASTNALAAAVAANTPAAPSATSQTPATGASAGSGAASDGQTSGVQGSPSAPANDIATGASAAGATDGSAPNISDQGSPGPTP